MGNATRAAGWTYKLEQTMYDFRWDELRGHCFDQVELMRQRTLDSVGLESLRVMLSTLLAIESGQPSYQLWCDRLGETLLQIQEHRPLTEPEQWRITAGKDRGAADRGAARNYAWRDTASLTGVVASM